MSVTANGTHDIWWILEGKDYPRLWWEPDKENSELIAPEEAECGRPPCSQV
jgi:hypothetical protein